MAPTIEQERGRDAQQPRITLQPKSTPRTHRRSQRQRLLELLLSQKNKWVRLPVVMRVAGSQYSARVCELRKAGWKIQNRTLEIVNGQRRTAFRIPTDTKNVVTGDER